MLTWHHRQFFWSCFIYLVNFSYWSKFHINIITGSGVMTISFYKGLTRNPEIRNTPIWVLPNIWRLERVRSIKFGTKFSSKMLMNAAKCQGYSFYRFWVIKEKPTWFGVFRSSFPKLPQYLSTCETGTTQPTEGLVTRVTGGIGAQFPQIAPIPEYLWNRYNSIYRRPWH